MQIQDKKRVLFRCFIFCAMIIISTIMVIAGGLNTKTKVTEKIYVYEDKTELRSITVVQKSSKEITFELLIKNKTNGYEKKINGSAVMKGGDLEIDEDEDGNAYPCYEYVFKSDDNYMGIRIDAETGDRLTISSSNKEIESDVILKIKK